MRPNKPAGRKKVKLGERAEPAREYSPAQPPLAIAMALGHRWLRLLEGGRFASISKIAEAVGMDASQLRRYLNLTLLSPEMVRRVVDGTEPEGMSLRELARDPCGDWWTQPVRPRG